MVKAQQVRDQRISDLVSTMEDTYSFVAFADELKANGVLQDIVEKILKQTIECGFFIQKYTQHNFGGRMITQPLSGTDDRITKFCDVFVCLRRNFKSRVNLNTALVLSRTTVTVDAIRRDQLLSTLKSVEMNEYDRKDCLPKTRLDVMKSFMDWIADESIDRKRVLWLHGLAGSGKSTLSTTIAWRMRHRGCLGGFFFLRPRRTGEECCDFNSDASIPTFPIRCTHWW